MARGCCLTAVVVVFFYFMPHIGLVWVEVSGHIEGQALTFIFLPYLFSSKR